MGLRLEFFGRLEGDLAALLAFARRRARRAGGRAFFLGRRLEVVLHPAAVPLRIEVSADHWLEGEAPTAACGPGYHDAVCEFLSGLRARLAPELTVEDETDYFALRELAPLQRAARDWRVAVGAKISSALREGAPHVLFALPAGSVANVRRGRVASSLGVYTLAEWERATEDVRAGRDLARHFPWWSPGRDAFYWRNLGLTLMNVRDLPGDRARRERLLRAVEACERALALDPAIDVPRARMARITLEFLEEPERALPHLRAAVAERPADHALRYELGLLLDDLGRHAEAASVLEELLERRPNDAVVAYNAGLIRCIEGEYERAVELLARAAKIAPRRAAIHAELAVALAGAGRLDEALEAAERAIALGGPPQVRELRETIRDLMREAEKPSPAPGANAASPERGAAPARSPGEGAPEGNAPPPEDAGPDLVR